MKTPRELLFERHRSTEPKLDDIRQQAVATIRDRNRSKELNSPAVIDRRYSSWPKWLLSLRWHLAGMGAVWLIVLFLNVDRAPASIAALPKGKIPSPRQLLMALMENRRELLRLIEQPATEPVSRPPRRSEYQSPQAMV